MKKSMKIIAPNEMTDAMLDSSTRAETDFAEWSNATTYALGDKVIKAATHRIYQSTQAGNLNHDPETAGVSWWIDIGPTNRWAMYDDVIGTVSTATTTMTDVLRPGSVSAIALLELTGTDVEITMKDAPGGTVVYHREIVLDETFVDSFYSWFYTPLEQKTEVVLTDLPGHFASCELTITINGVGAIGCGVCKFGDVVEIGQALMGAGLEIIDYSRKVKDENFGTLSIVERSFSKLVTLNVLTQRKDFSHVVRKSAALRAKLCVFIATDKEDLDPLIVYGFYRGFRVVIEYNDYHKCALQIEGII